MTRSPLRKRALSSSTRYSLRRASYNRVFGAARLQAGDSVLGKCCASKRHRLFRRGGIEGVAHAFGFGEDAQGVFTQDIADVGFRIALFQECVGDLREMRDILHPEGHYGAIEIGAE